MANQVILLDWNGNPFTDIYEVSYIGERLAFVPQITIGGQNQLEKDFWVRYYTLNDDSTEITGCVMVGPASLPENDPRRVGEKGLTPDAMHVLGLTNIYDEDGLIGSAGSTKKLITFEIFDDMETSPGVHEPDLRSPIWAKGGFTWNGKPVIDEGVFEEPIPIVAEGEGPKPYIFQLNPAKPTVTFIGDVEEIEFDPNNPDEVYYASGYELAYSNDYRFLFRDAIERRIIAISAENPNDLVVSGKGAESETKTYTSGIRPSDLRVVMGDNPGENPDLWRNFAPLFKIKRQIKLIIRGQVAEGSGIGIPVSATKVYDGRPLCPVVENSQSGVTVEYSEDGINFSSSPISITDAGTKYVTVRVSGISEEALYGYYSITVTPRPIYITSDSASWDYNGGKNTCDWVTVQGHYDAETSSLRIPSRFEPMDPEDPDYDPEHPRMTGDIPLIKPGDYMKVEFKGGQAEIGSSSNAFDFEVISAKPNNYDIRIEFGLLKVNLGSQDIYVFIRGNTKGTWYDPDDFSDPATKNYIIWDNSFIQEKDKVCTYNGGIWTTTGWQVVAVTDDFLVLPDPFNLHEEISIPTGNDLSEIYGVKDFEFIGKETDAEVSGVYINDIVDNEDVNYWKSVEYRSLLSADNFKNINTGFSSRYIHFVVSPNRLLISKNQSTISITGHHNTFDFNMIKPLGGDNWIPEFRTVEGCDFVADNPIYDTSDIIYRKPNPRGGKDLTKPLISAGTVNEENEDPEDGKWYMNLENDIHDGESDKDAPFVPVPLEDPDYPNKGSFINTNKNFEVSFDVAEDGWILIEPIDVEVYIRGTQKTVVYDANEHDIIGTREVPEIWWRSDCVFYNWESMAEAVANEDTLESGVHWIWQYKEQTEESETIDSSTQTLKSTEKEKRTTYYRAIHEMKYFEWDEDGDTGEHTDINETDTTPDDSQYWESASYPMEDLIESNFYADDESEFNENLDYPNHIYKNIIPEFIIIEKGSLTITPYPDTVSVYIAGETLDNQDYTGSEQTVSGYKSKDTDTPIYDPESDEYVSGPEDPEARGTDPGVYVMGLSSNDFKNINKNFSKVVFIVVDGWIQIGNTDIDQEVTGEEAKYKIFDNSALEIEDPAGVSSPKRYEQNPDYDPSDPDSSEWIEKSGNLEVYDSGNYQFKIESNKTGSVLDIKTSGKIIPLYLSISSASETWIYDGEAHHNHDISMKLINSENALNINSALDFANEITSTIEESSMPEIRETGTISNEFAIGNVSDLFDANVQNKKYVINGYLYEDGEKIGKWDPNSTPTPNVIITTYFGTLEVSTGINTVTIKGLEKTILYDGRPHSLRGYTVNPPINIPLAAGINPEEFYENTIDKIKASDDPYRTVLAEDNFDWPANVVNRVIDGDVLLKIDKRPLLITTGSDTSHFDDEDPEHVAKNETFNAYGLADTDCISPSAWTSITSGSSPNEMTYEIIGIEDGQDTSSNYIVAEKWGLLKIRHASDASMYYRILGIRKNITSPDTDKVKIYGLKHIDGILRMVDEDRFYPALHKLMPISEDGSVDPGDVICIVPVFKHGKKIENVTWMFENKSTGEKIFSKVYDRPIFPDGNYGGAWMNYKDYGGLADTPVLNVTPREMKPGYYDITVNYRMDKTDYSQKFSSVFVVEKKKKS